MKVFFLTSFALAAFAFNSILCRMALWSGEADPAGFTVVRIVSGALTLAVLLSLSGKTKTIRYSGNWLSAFLLFAYAITFSFAYLGLTAATGALILFGSVQMTMVGISIFRGLAPSFAEWLGLVIAIGGLIYLVFPGLSAPPVMNASLMAAAGVAWGVYTLRGKTSSDPLAETTGNFIRSVPMAVLSAVPFIHYVNVSYRGFILAAISGAITSGVGYAVWYAALRSHTPTRAAVLQLAVPVLTAFGGIALLSESADLRLLIAGILILGGIGLTILGRKS